MAHSHLELIRRQYRENGLSGVTRKAVEHCLFRRPRIAPTLYWRIAPKYYRRLASDDAEAYDAPLNPFTRLSVPPDRITKVTGREHPPWKNRLRKFGTVRGGSWDRRKLDAGPGESDTLDRFAELEEFAALQERFVDGSDWTAIKFVQKRIERAERGELTWHQCSSKEDVLERCRRIDALYDAITTEGYLTQEERLARTDEKLGFPDLLDETTVDIGRDGRLLFVDGKHRLSIAKILELPAVPVVVHVRHAEWMRRRDRAYRGDGPFDHPDLREFESGRDAPHSTAPARIE